MQSASFEVTKQNWAFKLTAESSGLFYSRQSPLTIKDDATKTGNLFCGWYTEQNGGGTTWHDLTTEEFVKPESINVRKKASGGSDTMANLLIPITDTLTPNAFTRTDYKFLCWSTSFSATSATYTDGGQITIIGETTLYAVWQLKFRASKSNVVAGDIAVKHTNGSIRYAPQAAWSDSSYADYNGYTNVVGVCVSTGYMMGLEQKTDISYNQAVTWAGNYGTTHMNFS